MGIGIPIAANSGGGGGGGSGPCFIATAAYGTPMNDAVDTLRMFRDVYLLDNALGTAFVDAYYRISPPIAHWVASSPLLAATVRLMLNPVVLLARILLSLPPVALMSSFALMFAGVLRYRIAGRKSKSKPGA